MNRAPRAVPLRAKPTGEILLGDPRFASFLDAAGASQLQAHFPGAPKPQIWDVAAGSIRELRAAGVDLLAGTDSANPGTTHGASLHQELELMVQAGLTPLEALRAATSAPARRFHLGDRGPGPGERRSDGGHPRDARHPDGVEGRRRAGPRGAARGGGALAPARSGSRSTRCGSSEGGGAGGTAPSHAWA